MNELFSNDHFHFHLFHIIICNFTREKKNAMNNRYNFHFVFFFVQCFCLFFYFFHAKLSVLWIKIIHFLVLSAVRAVHVGNIYDLLSYFVVVIIFIVNCGRKMNVSLVFFIVSICCCCGFCWQCTHSFRCGRIWLAIVTVAIMTTRLRWGWIWITRFMNRWQCWTSITK